MDMFLKYFFLRRMKHRLFSMSLFMNGAAGGSAQNDSATGGNPPDQELGFSYQVKYYVSFLLRKKYFKSMSIFT